MTKHQVVQAIIASLEERFKRHAKASRDARNEATGEGNKAESKYDTRSLEAGYLANGQAMQAERISDALEDYCDYLENTDLEPLHERIRCGSLVEAKLAGAPTLLYIGLEHDGMELSVDGQAINVLSLQSPLAQSLLGLKVGGRLLRPSVHVASVS